MYESSLFLYVKIVPHVRRWRKNFRERKYKAKVDAALRGFVVKERLNWILDEPLGLGEDPSFMILKE